MSYKDPDIQRAYQAGYIAGRRQLWLQEHGPCVKCGSWDNLEVDHIDPEQKETHYVWSLNKEDRERELAKCQVLCRTCHREKTAAMFRKPLVHGTTNAYNQKRCRCDECRAWNAERNRRLRNPGAVA